MPVIVKIKPKPADLRIPMPEGYGVPHGEPLPAEGLTVPKDDFIRRLISSGDVEVVPLPDPPAAAASQPAGKPAAPPSTPNAGIAA